MRNVAETAMLPRAAATQVGDLLLTSRKPHANDVVDD